MLHKYGTCYVRDHRLLHYVVASFSAIIVTTIRPAKRYRRSSEVVSGTRIPSHARNIKMNVNRYLQQGSGDSVVEIDEKTVMATKVCLRTELTIKKNKCNMSSVAHIIATTAGDV